MSARNKNYILFAIILIFFAVIIRIYNIPYLDNYLNIIVGYMKNIYVAIPALVCAIILMRRGAYWLFVLMCGMIDVFYITYNDGISISEYSITIPLLLSFLLIVFAVNVIKALFSN